MGYTPVAASTNVSLLARLRPGGRRRVARRGWHGYAALIRVVLLIAAGCAIVRAQTTALGQPNDGPPGAAYQGNLIGYTQFRADDPGGMHPYLTSQRAYVARRDGTRHRAIAAELVRQPNGWTRFSGWSPDGRFAIVGRGWESPDNAAWEKAHRTFRMTEGWLYDMCLWEVRTGDTENVTAVDRVSIYNTGLFFWGDGSRRLGFQALIDGQSHPFVMDRNGRNKRDLTPGSAAFTYGFSASPDGEHIAYHKDYQVVIADADGSKPRRIETGNPFNFVPQWSPNSHWLLFLSGEHYDCHLYIVRSDGTAMRKLADRNGYRGVVECLDKPAFHSASSDVPVWSADGRWIYYSANVKDSVELLRVSVEGNIERLTQSPSGSLNYHPQVSPDNRWLCWGSNRTGIRQLYVRSLRDHRDRALTKLGPGQAAMWPHWQPEHGER